MNCFRHFLTISDFPAIMKLFSVVFLLLATSANAFVVTPAAVKAPAASSFTAAVPRAVAPNMGILPETNAPGGPCTPNQNMIGDESRER